MTSGKNPFRCALGVAPEYIGRCSAAALAVFALFVFNRSALAATDTWTGADTLGSPTTDWANADNWSYSSGAGPVASGDSLVFTIANGQSTTTLTDSLTNSTFDINGITFNTGAVGYTMTGNAFALNGNIIDDSTSVEAINNPISVVAATATLTMVSGASLQLGGAVTGAGNLATTGTGAVTFGNLQTTGNLTVGVPAVTGVAANSVVINSGSFGSSSSTLSVDVDFQNQIDLVINGGTATYGTVNIGEAGGESGASMEITGGTSNFTTTAIGGNPANPNGSQSNTGGSITITGGTVNLGGAYLGRDQTNATAAGLGLVVNGSTAVVSATSVNLSSNAAVNHEADFNMEAGSMTIGNSSSTGAFEVGTTSGDGNNVITMSGGTLTYLGTDGLLLGSLSFLKLSGGILTLSSLTVNSTATGGNGTSEVTVTGGALYLGGAPGGQGLIMNTPGTTVFFDIQTATLGAVANWTSSAPIVLTGAGFVIQAGNASGTGFNISLSGAISGAHSFNKTGNGILTLSGNNTYGVSSTGNGTSINAGTLNVDSANALGIGLIAFGGGTLQYSSANQTDYSSRLNTTGSTAPVSIDTNGQNVTFATALTTANAPDGLNVMDSVGTGSLKLTQVETYTAATNVYSGTLIVSGSLSGSSVVTVGNSASLATPANLAGGGLVGSVTLGAAVGNTGAEIEPADGVAEAVGAGTTLTTGAFSILTSSTSTLALQVGRGDGVDSVSLGGDSSDKINATSVSLNSSGNLSLSLETGYTPAIGDVLYLIISGAAPTGTFATVNGSAITSNRFTFDGDTWQIGYNVTSGGVFSGGDDVAIEALAAIPEPGTWAMMLAGLGMLGVWQRSRGQRS